MALESQAKDRWDRSDYIALIAAIMSVFAVLVSVVFSYRAYALQVAQNGIVVVSGFSDRDVVDAGYAVLRWSENLPKNQDQLLTFRQEASPMGRQLQTVAACLVDRACQGKMVLDVFCSRSEDYDQVVLNAHNAAGIAKAADDEFYAEAKAMCTGRAK